MTGRWRRVRELMRRYVVDRRLPPPVALLLRDLALLAMQSAVRVALARIRPAVGRRQVSCSVARLRSRRLWAAQPTGVSMHDLAHEVAASVLAALERADVAAFVVERSGNSLVLAVSEQERRLAWDSLSTALVEPGWFVEWRIGNRSRLAWFGALAAWRQARSARAWRIFRGFDWKGRVVGDESAVELTFWAEGSSGQIEQIGTRGNARYDARAPQTQETVDGRSYPGNAAFPVASAIEYFDQPIDVVVTWVDGSDPDWRQAFEQWARREGRNVTSDALAPARYRTRDELRYCLRSIWFYCGWVRTIYLVTSGQVPAWLAPSERLRLVTHGDILPDDALPTFNSHAIEAALHKIDGLAEHFVYFNDDMFVARAARPELFFTSNGLARVFPSSARVPGFEDDQTLAVDTAARRGRELMAARFGKVATYKPHHSPYPLRRSVMYEVENEFAEVVKQTQHSRFRSPADLSTAASFCQHYALATGRAVLSDIATEYVHVESGRLAWHLRRLSLSRSFDTFCINETGNGAGLPGRESMIARFLQSAFPVPAPWER